MARPRGRNFDSWLRIRIPGADEALLHAAAVHDGMSLSAWAHQHLVAAALKRQKPPKRQLPAKSITVETKSDAPKIPFHLDPRACDRCKRIGSPACDACRTLT